MESQQNKLINKLIYLLVKRRILKFTCNSLGNETIEVLGFKTIDALEKQLEILTKNVKRRETCSGYKN